MGKQNLEKTLHQLRCKALEQQAKAESSAALSRKINDDLAEAQALLLQGTTKEILQAALLAAIQAKANLQILVDAAGAVLEDVQTQLEAACEIVDATQSLLSELCEGGGRD